MRVLLAIATFVAGVLATSPSADAARKYTHRAQPPCYAAHPCRVWRGVRPYRAWRFDQNDPTGEFRGFPGWARKAFTNLRN